MGRAPFDARTASATGKSTIVEDAAAARSMRTIAGRG
jgi:hypothetical protein